MLKKLLSNSFRRFLLASFCIGGLSISPALAQHAIVGGNVVGTDQASDQTKDALLAQLQCYQVRTIRTSLGGHGDRYTSYVITAFQHGIGAVVFVNPSAGGTNNTTRFRLTNPPGALGLCRRCQTPTPKASENGLKQSWQSWTPQACASLPSSWETN
jgi:hypothetical protein